MVVAVLISSVSFGAGTGASAGATAGVAPGAGVNLV
jgi:hypothetical protein